MAKGSACLEAKDSMKAVMSKKPLFPTPSGFAFHTCSSLLNSGRPLCASSFYPSAMKTSFTRVLTLLLVASFYLVHAAPQPDKAEKDGKPLTPQEQEREMNQKVESFGWTRSGKGKLGTMAEIQIPQGYRFTGASGCKKMLELTHNIPGDSELGVIAPEDLGWWVLFEYDETGYVKDTDKDKLDADAILKQLKEGQEQANDERVKQGLGELYLDGWAMPPRYNETTHNLEWAIKVRSERGGTSINYLTKLLGRKGVMHVTLLVNPEGLQSTLPNYQKLLTGFSYTAGQSYAEYRQGDKVAQYALTGLITGGAGIALMKSGWLAKGGILLAKFGKLLILPFVLAFAALKKVFMKLFGRESTDNHVP
ncbi:MAG: hypothetical protein JWO08_3567 [Verrucomicrobiaceae bacterium]|nr:hypothetical protein [Verrucomicrobiaceae bacterium]